MVPCRTNIQGMPLFLLCFILFYNLLPSLKTQVSYNTFKLIIIRKPSTYFQGQFQILKHTQAAVNTAE